MTSQPLNNVFFSIIGELKKLKDPQRLTGRDAKNAYVIVQTVSKDTERGITRPSAYIYL
jgi:hypothetical protein